MGKNFTLKNIIIFIFKSFDNFFSKNKKAISPVVATALLVVVAVVAVVGFQTWFGSFSSIIFSKTELRTNDEILSGTLEIEDLIGSTLYVENQITDNMSINTLKIGGVECNITQNLNLGVNEINVAACLSSITTQTPSIVLITDEKIIDKQLYYNDPILQSCSLDSLIVYSSQSGVFYNSSVGFSTCYSQIRTCSDGTLNGSGSYNYSSCASYYDLNCITDLDSDAYINSSCGKYPMTNTTLMGNLDTNDNNNTIKPDMSCIFKGHKNSTSCINNFVVDGCGNGTVQDMSTGLCWQRNMSTGGTRNWANAISYCDALSLGGNSNWRLPTRVELFSITDSSRYNPSIIGGNNNKYLNVVSSDYSSYSTYGPFNTTNWLVNFNTGDTSTGFKSSSYYVVCVR